MKRSLPLTCQETGGENVTSRAAGGWFMQHQFVEHRRSFFSHKSLGCPSRRRPALLAHLGAFGLGEISTQCQCTLPTRGSPSSADTLLRRSGAQSFFSMLPAVGHPANGHSLPLCPEPFVSSRHASIAERRLVIGGAAAPRTHRCRSHILAVACGRPVYPRSVWPKQRRPRFGPSGCLSRRRFCVDGGSRGARP